MKKCLNLSKVPTCALEAELLKRKGKPCENWGEDFIKELDFHGVTVKDFVIIYSTDDYEPEVTKYSFFVKKYAKVLNIYYQTDEIFPYEDNDTQDEKLRGGLAKFIPMCFNEYGENVYTSSLSEEETLKLLKKLGFSTQHVN